MSAITSGVYITMLTHRLDSTNPRKSDARMGDADDALGNDRQRSVGLLRYPHQQFKRRRGVDIETFHEHAFGLADDVAGFKSTAKLLNLLSHRTRTVPLRSGLGSQRR